MTKLIRIIPIELIYENGKYQIYPIRYRNFKRIVDIATMYTNLRRRINNSGGSVTWFLGDKIRTFATDKDLNNND